MAPTSASARATTTVCPVASAARAVVTPGANGAVRRMAPAAAAHAVPAGRHATREHAICRCKWTERSSNRKNTILLCVVLTRPLQRNGYRDKLGVRDQRRCRHGCSHGRPDSGGDVHRRLDHCGHRNKRRHANCKSEMLGVQRFPAIPKDQETLTGQNWVYVTSTVISKRAEPTADATTTQDTVTDATADTTVNATAVATGDAVEEAAAPSATPTDVPADDSAAHVELIRPRQEDVAGSESAVQLTTTVSEVITATVLVTSLVSSTTIVLSTSTELESVVHTSTR